MLIASAAATAAIAYGPEAAGADVFHQRRTLGLC